MKATYQMALMSCAFLFFGCGAPGDENILTTKNEDSNPVTTQSKRISSIDSLDPFDAGCFSTGSVIAQSDYMGIYYVQLWYSCKCKTYWAVARTPGSPLSSISVTVQPFFGAGLSRTTKTDTAYVNTEMMSDTGIDAQAYANFEYAPFYYVTVSTPPKKVPAGLCS